MTTVKRGDPVTVTVRGEPPRTGRFGWTERHRRYPRVYVYLTGDDGKRHLRSFERGEVDPLPPLDLDGVS